MKDSTSRYEPYVYWHEPLPEPAIKKGMAALLVIDMQYQTHPDYGMFAQRRAKGQTEGIEYFAARLHTVIPNIRRLQEGFRKKGIEVISTRVQSMTQDGRDRSLDHKQLGILCPPGSKEAEILEELAPEGDEMVFSKTAGSVFNATNIHYVLTNMGIKSLVMVGAMTAGCVESAARDARDLGYGVIVVEDACLAWTQEQHDFAIRLMSEVYGKIKSTDEVLAMIEEQNDDITGRNVKR